MQIIRFADQCAQGQARGKRVFIRADLNVPFDDQGRISEDTRIRASVPAIQLALAAGAAVMVTAGMRDRFVGAPQGIDAASCCIAALLPPPSPCLFCKLYSQQ